MKYFPEKKSFHVPALEALQIKKVQLSNSSIQLVKVRSCFMLRCKHKIEYVPRFSMLRHYFIVHLIHFAGQAVRVLSHLKLMRWIVIGIYSLLIKIAESSKF